MTKPRESVAIQTSSAEQTRDVGAALARVLQAGDLVVLSGGLGAGKTTLVQGLGAALGVRGRVTSPTYIIARTHPSLGDGPDLIHVDAYRVEDQLDLETIDLDGSLEDAVTVVEWGGGKVEALSESWFEVELHAEEDLDSRLVSVRVVGALSQERLEDLTEVLSEMGLGV